MERPPTGLSPAIMEVPPAPAPRRSRTGRIVIGACLAASVLPSAAIAAGDTDAPAGKIPALELAVPAELNIAAQQQRGYGGAIMNCTTETFKPYVSRAGNGWKRTSSGFISCIETQRGYVAESYIEICQYYKTRRGWRIAGGSSLIGCASDTRIGAGFNSVSVSLPCNLDLDKKRQFMTVIRPWRAVPGAGSAYGVTVTNRYRYSKPLADRASLPC